MNKTLLIEIKDNKATVTLSSYNGKVSLLYKNTFIFRPLEGKILFDQSWIQTMKKEVSSVVAFETIDNVTLITNTKGTLIKTKRITLPLKTNLEQKIISLKNDIENNKSPMLHLIDLNVKEISKNVNGIKVSVTYELINKELYRQIHNSFSANDITINSDMAVNRAVENSMIPYMNNSDILYLVEVESRFTSISTFKDGFFLETTKLNGGLDLIYKNISFKMKINKNLAKSLFTSFGHIPPETVSDNKVIYSKIDTDNRVQSFTKKDLSLYITEIVNEIFNELKGRMNTIENSSNNSNSSIIFAGAISTLSGFDDYAKIALSISSDVNIFNSNIIGLDQESSMMFVGSTNEVNKSFNITSEKQHILKGDNYIVNKTNNFSKVFNKINRMYNYI